MTIQEKIVQLNNQLDEVEAAQTYNDVTLERLSKRQRELSSKRWDLIDQLCALWDEVRAEDAAIQAAFLEETKL